MAKRLGTRHTAALVHAAKRITQIRCCQFTLRARRRSRQPGRTTGRVGSGRVGRKRRSTRTGQIGSGGVGRTRPGQVRSVRKVRKVQVRSGQVRSESGRVGQVRSGQDSQGRSGRVRPGQVRSGRVGRERRSDWVRSGPVRPVRSEQPGRCGRTSLPVVTDLPRVVEQMAPGGRTAQSCLVAGTTPRGAPLGPAQRRPNLPTQNYRPSLHRPVPLMWTLNGSHDLCFMLAK